MKQGKKMSKFIYSKVYHMQVVLELQKGLIELQKEIKSEIAFLKDNVLTIPERPDIMSMHKKLEYLRKSCVTTSNLLTQLKRVKKQIQREEQKGTFITAASTSLPVILKDTVDLSNYCQREFSLSINLQTIFCSFFGTTYLN